jgi:hypothetical protein
LLHLETRCCHASAYVECTCPEGWSPAGRGHLSAPVAALATAVTGAAGVPVEPCPMASLGAAVSCLPECGQCTAGHDHDAAANACPGIADRHGMAACPEPETCRTWRSTNADEHRALRDAGQAVPPCPGGHCHADLPGCTVCRPITITVMPGSAQLQPATQLGG